VSQKYNKDDIKQIIKKSKTPIDAVKQIMSKYSVDRKTAEGWIETVLFESTNVDNFIEFLTKQEG